MRAVSRVLIIGDVHAEHEALARALDLAARSRVDAVLSVGDVVDGEGDLEASVRLLREAGALCVAGNHERWLFEGTLRSLPGAHKLAHLSDDARAFFASLSKTLAFDTPRGMLLLCHGMGEDDMRGLLPDSSAYDIENHDELQRLLRERTFSFVACGHTHRRMIRSVHGLTVLNAGALPEEDGPSCILADFEEGWAEVHDVTARGCTVATRHDV